MIAVVKMDITLYDSKGNIVARDNSERQYETMPSNYKQYGSYNKHAEELHFAWVVIVDNETR